MVDDPAALAALTDWIDPKFLIQTFGLIGITLIVFMESGVLIGLFFPGDSLLITAGVFAANGDLPIAALLPLVFVAAAAGDSVGYTFGRRAGPALYRKPDSRVFKREHLERATRFYEKHGGMAIVLARFVPIVRTLAPIVAGAARMNYGRFLRFNLVGAFIWGIGVTTLGYALGRAIPDLERYILLVIGIVVGLSLLPPVIEILRARRRRAAVPSPDGNTTPLE